MIASPEAEHLTDAELDEARRSSMQVARDDEDGSHVVGVDDLPGLHTHGRSREEALRTGIEAVATCLAGLRHSALPVPPPTARRSVIDKPPAFGPSDIKAIRRRIGASQAVFAAILNVCPETVRAWEQGKTVPDDPSARLRQLAAKNPVGFRRLVRSDPAVGDRDAQVPAAPRPRREPDRCRPTGSGPASAPRRGPAWANRRRRPPAACPRRTDRTRWAANAVVPQPHGPAHRARAEARWAR